MSSNLIDALKEYFLRASNKSHPKGTFDSARRWYPSIHEISKCCKTVRKPAANAPNNLLKHCFSIKHVASVYGVDADELNCLVLEVKQHLSSDVSGSKVAATNAAIENIEIRLSVLDC
jgi:hypothetical protein